MRIRAFEAGDAELVAGLWQYWFRNKTLDPDPSLTDLVHRIYLENPNNDPEVGSLVAEDDDGTFLGFLGVSVTPIRVNDRDDLVAGVFPSVLAPNAPTTVAAYLLRKLLAGPQAISFSDGGHAKFERIWEALGGGIGPIQSTRWLKVLKPVELAATLAARRRGSIRTIEPVLRPLARMFDVVARRAMPARFTSSTLIDADHEWPKAVDVGGYTTEELTPALLGSLGSQFNGRSKAFPIYSKEHAAWQFSEMAKIRQQGEFRPRLVRSADGKPVGWLAYYFKDAGLSSVYAVEGLDKHYSALVDVLFAEAEAAGAQALTGRFEPRLRRLLRERGAFTHNGGSLQMFHSKDKQLMHEALLGHTRINRLQGENWYWWAIGE